MYKIGNIGKNKYRFFRRYKEMHFIGVFSNYLEFEIIKENIENHIKQKNLQLIHITSRNIDNMKNIVFETILLCDKTNIKEAQKDILNKICSNCKYIIMNADVFSNTKIIMKKMNNCITYGLNQKSTITVSSIQEDKAIIYVQRNLKNIEEKEIEMGETSIDLENKKQMSIETILAIFSIFLIYN